MHCACARQQAVNVHYERWVCGLLGDTGLVAEGMLAYPLWYVIMFVVASGRTVLTRWDVDGAE